MVAQELGRSLTDAGWLYVWPLLGLALLVSLRRGAHRSLLPVTLLPPLLIGCYAATFLVLDGYSREVLRGAVERLLYHAFPTALVATLAVLLPAVGAPRVDASHEVT